MARTKKSKPGHAGRARRFREQNEALQGNPTPAFMMMNGGALSEGIRENESDDETMDPDKSGGISIDMSHFSVPKPLQPGSNITDENGESEMREWYLQHPIEFLNETGDLWQQPRPNSRNRKAARGNNVHFKVPALYNQCCRLISKHWQCDFERYIPEELRKQTPYSLALLTQLRKLASKTKRNHTLAHATLLKVWHDRISEFQNPNPEWPYQFVETHSRIDQECESSIQEHIYGLMIADVQIALSRVNNHKGSGLPRKKDKLRNQGRTVGELVEGMFTEGRVKKSRVEKRGDKAVRNQKCRRERMEEKERNRLANAGAHPPPGTESHGIAIAPPNSPVMQTSNKFSALSDQFTISNRTRSQITMPPDLPHAEATEELSYQDKENYESMTRLMMKMGVKHNRRLLGKRRLKSIAAGGLSRRAAGVPLPSERTNLGNVSALPAVESNSVPGWIAQTNQMSLEDLPD